MMKHRYSPIVVGENDRALTLARELEERGVIITAIRPPTVPVGESRLRMTVTAAHSKEQLDMSQKRYMNY